MTSEYGHKLNPHRKLRRQKGIKGIRRTLFNTHVPSTIDQTGILEVRFPDLGKEDAIVPGTSKLSFKIQLKSDNDANRTIVNNLGRATVSKLEVKLEGRSIFTLDDSDVFLCYQDLWKTSQERSNAVYQGIQSAAVRKIKLTLETREQLQNTLLLVQLIVICFVYHLILKYLNHTCLSFKVNFKIVCHTSLRLTIMEK